VGIALGVLKMTENEFWGMTPRVFFNAFDAYIKQREQDIHISWEQARFIAVGMVNCFLKKPIKNINYVRFPWETSVADPDEAKRQFDYWVKRFDRIERRYGRN
jgi:hypothetical protein